MNNFNNNVYKQGHFESWNDKFGQNFTENFSDVHKQAMLQKNIETGGAYQAAVSGAYGEFTIAAVFKSLPDYYYVMNDTLLQQGTMLRPYQPDIYGQSPWQIIKKGNRLFEVVKKSTQLDHLIVSPFGIFVIETKNHKGFIFGDMNSKVWTQVLKGENGVRSYNGKAHFTFHNPVAQNWTHVQELSKQIQVPLTHMVGMIVFTNPDANLANVNCNCCFTVDRLYEAILSYNNQLWTEKQLEAAVKRIEKMDTNSYTLAKEHTTYVQDLKHHQEINRMLYRRHQT